MSFLRFPWKPKKSEKSPPSKYLTIGMFIQCLNEYALHVARLAEFYRLIEMAYVSRVGFYDSASVVKFYSTGKVPAPNSVQKIRWISYKYEKGKDGFEIKRAEYQEAFNQAVFDQAVADVQNRFRAIQKVVPAAFIEQFKARQIAHFNSKCSPPEVKTAPAAQYTEIQRELVNHLHWLGNLLAPKQASQAAAIIMEKCKPGTPLTAEIAQELSLALFVGRDISVVELPAGKRILKEFFRNYLSNLTEIIYKLNDYKPEHVQPAEPRQTNNSDPTFFKISDPLLSGTMPSDEEKESSGLLRKRFVRRPSGTFDV